MDGLTRGQNEGCKTFLNFQLLYFAALTETLIFCLICTGESVNNSAGWLTNLCTR